MQEVLLEIMLLLKGSITTLEKSNSDPEGVRFAISCPQHELVGAFTIDRTHSFEAGVIAAGDHQEFIAI